MLVQCPCLCSVTVKIRQPLSELRACETRVNKFSKHQLFVVQHVSKLQVFRLSQDPESKFFRKEATGAQLPVDWLPNREAAEGPKSAASRIAEPGRLGAV